MLAILSAGMQGLEQKRNLVIKNLNKIMFVGFYSQEAADEFAVKEKMPTSLKESISRCQVPFVQSDAVEVKWLRNQGLGCSRRVTVSSLLGNSIFNNQRRLISDLPEERGSPYL
jgi:hypothetical protein